MMKDTGKKVVQESLCSSLCIPVDRQKTWNSSCTVAAEAQEEAFQFGAFQPFDDLQIFPFFGTALES